MRASRTPPLDLPLKFAYLGYPDKLRIQSKSQQRLWKLRKKVKQRQRNKTQLSYHDKWRDGVPLLTQRGWKSLILQGSTDSGIQNLRSFPDFFSKTIISLSRLKIIKHTLVPERPISVNPGLKFCSVFVFYIPMHCLIGEHFVLLRLNSIL